MKTNTNTKKKTHNQKIHDAHQKRKQEKEEAKQVQSLKFKNFRFVIIFIQAKEAHQQAVKEAMNRYKVNKQARLKKLVYKTRRGQPVMKGQIDLLLEKIQRQKNEK